MNDPADFDSPWKDVLDLFFESAIEFFFPTAHAQIDWARGYEFLDKELQKITADAALGRRAVDKLAQVWLKNGEMLRVLLHLEVQGQRETDFTWRVLVYHFRLLDRFAAPVATFVILTDEDKSWRPDEYHTELLGTELRLKFASAKLLDYAERWEELEQSDNPFAVVVQAHLAALRTRDNPQDRLQSKWQMTRRLYERGFDKRVIIGLFRFIDWVLVLTEDLAEEYDTKVSEYEEEKKMPYVTSIERKGMERGREIGMQEGYAKLVMLQLQHQFGALEESVQSHVSALPSAEIEALSVALFNLKSPTELEVWLQQHPLPEPTSAAATSSNGN